MSSNTAERDQQGVVMEKDDSKQRQPEQDEVDWDAEKIEGLERGSRCSGEYQRCVGKRNDQCAK